MIRKWIANLGPGTVIAAAFIGPGTVTVCTLAGVNFGMNLLWAMLLSVVATIILQEMAARVGIIAQKGLAEIVREEIKNPFFRQLTTILILAAIVIGNASYQAGNITGSVLGLETVFGTWALPVGDTSINGMSIIVGLVAFVLLYIGNYKLIEKALVSLVLFMSISFVLTALVTKPNLLEMIKGMLIPQFPEKSFWIILGLIGTTVVPYNLFLHASLVKERWKNANDLPFSKKDTIISITLGGLVSMAIIISGASMPTKDVQNAVDLAQSLVPLYGEFAKYFLALGLFAAGITSAITAPLAAAYVAQGCLGWQQGLKSTKFRSVWMFILAVGVVCSSIGIKPIEIIQFAQVANGMLLPIIAGLLLWIMNKKDVLGKYTNSKFQNFMGFTILAICLFLGIKSIITALHVF